MGSKLVKTVIAITATGVSVTIAGGAPAAGTAALVVATGGAAAVVLIGAGVGYGAYRWHQRRSETAVVVKS